MDIVFAFCKPVAEEKIVTAAPMLQNFGAFGGELFKEFTVGALVLRIRTRIPRVFGQLFMRCHEVTKSHNNTS